MYGTGGYARFQAGYSPRYFIVLADGSSVAADNGVLWHLDGEGRFDPSFGAGGTLQIPANTTSVRALASAPDGDFDVVNLFKVSVPQYTAHGVLDTSWGSGGFASAPIAGMATHAVALPDGRLLIGVDDGILAPATLRIVRFDAQGRLDTTYSGDGVADSGISLWDARTSIAARPDGSVAGLISGRQVTGGSAESGPIQESLVLFTPSGTTAATVSLSLGGPGYYTQVYAMADGSWLVANPFLLGSSPLLCVSASGGWEARTANFAASLTGRQGVAYVAVDAQGRVVIAGTLSSPGDAAAAQDATVIRLLPDGTLDTTFSRDGIARFHLGDTAQADQVTGVSVDAGGQVYVMGSAPIAGAQLWPNNQFSFVARLTVDGLLDDGTQLGLAAHATPVTITSTAWDTWIEKAYLAFFLRPAEPGGFAFYADAMQANGGDIWTISRGFGSSTEYLQTYAGLTTAQRIDAIYMNLFNRHAEPDGLAYWGGHLDSGALTINNIAISILLGAQNEDLATVDNRVAAALSFTRALDNTSLAAAYDGQTACINIKSWLGQVTSDASSLQAASQTLPEAIKTAGAIMISHAASGDTLAFSGSGHDALVLSPAANAGKSDTVAGFNGGTIDVSAFGLDDAHVAIRTVSTAQSAADAQFFSAAPVVIEHVAADSWLYVDVDNNGAFDPARDAVVHLVGTSVEFAAVMR